MFDAIVCAQVWHILCDTFDRDVANDFIPRSKISDNK